MRFLSFFLLSSCVLPVALPALAQPSGTQPWTVHDIYYPGARNASAPSDTSWSSDGTRMSFIAEDGSLRAWQTATGKESQLTSADKLRNIAKRPVNEQDRDHRNRYSQPNYFWSPNGSQILFDEDGTLWLDTLKTGNVQQVGDSGQGSGDDVKFSPDGSMVSYVHNHNLYVVKPGSSPVALTTTTDPNLRNGEVDWVYLEELTVRTNYAWSPDSQHLAYVQMDETNVPSYPMVDWLTTHPNVQEQKYPQAADPNPAVRLGVVAATGGETKWIDLPEVRANQDYIPRFGWVNASTVWIESLRRDHRHKDIWFADMRTGAVKHALAITDAKFLDETYDVWFPSPGTMLLISWKSGFNHVERYSYSAADPMSSGLTFGAQLEQGDYQVSNIASVTGNTVYYTSNEGDPLSSNLWAIGLDGSGKQRITRTPGMHRIDFAEGHTAYTDDASDMGVPGTLSLCTVGGACRALFHAELPANHVVRAPQVLELKAADGKTTIYATLLLPEGKTQAASVPLINNPYGGPGSQNVNRAWTSDLYFDQLLTEHGFAVLRVDNRGMSGRGRDFAQASYHDFGKVQFADQMAAIDQVLAKFPQLDGKRLGWWGRSWGGTFTLNALTHSDRFRAGISVAPVTDFRLYDSIYTERYLGVPVAEAGEPSDAAIYDAAAVQKTVAQLHGHLMIVHGTGDDNVHPGNTIQYIQALIDAHKPYDLQLFPRKTHSIAGAVARTQLYDRIVSYWEQYLMPETPVQ